MEQWTGSKCRKEYIEAIYCHPAYLTYIQSTSYEMLGWMKHKLESRLPGEISINLRFSNESALRLRWPKYWSFSFNISPSNSGLVSFRMDWLDLLAVQGTPKSLLQYHSSKASILRCSAFFNSPTLTSIYDHWKKP